MLITTTKGEMEDGLLCKREGSIDNEIETTSWVEYWYGGDPSCSHRFEAPAVNCLSCPSELVHRSVRMILKQAATFADGSVASF